MAGSYNHIVRNNGKLISNEKFPQMIENLGDAYEAVEEMYGMIQWLAQIYPDPKTAIEEARRNYKEGIELG